MAVRSKFRTSACCKEFYTSKDNECGYQIQCGHHWSKELWNKNTVYLPSPWCLIYNGRTKITAVNNPVCDKKKKMGGTQESLVHTVSVIPLADVVRVIYSGSEDRSLIRPWEYFWEEIPCSLFSIALSSILLEGLPFLLFCLVKSEMGFVIYVVSGGFVN